MANRVWVLGAPDAEMSWIEALLTAVGETVVHATAEGRRCHGGNAYRMDPPAVPTGSRLILVECGASVPDDADTDDVANGYVAPSYGDGVEVVTVCDHHRHGDPGFGRPPEEYLEASSAGQVVRAMQLRGLLPRLSEAGGTYQAAMGPLAPLSDYIADTFGLAPLTYIAAADHCLAAAYAGRCPGIDPGTLLGLRLEAQAAFRKVPLPAVRAEFDAASAALSRAAGYATEEESRHERQWRADYDDWQGVPPGEGDGWSKPYPHPHRWEHVKDMRGRVMPGLPEAACRLGVAYLATVIEGGRVKVVLGGAATPKDVEDFLAGDMVPGLTGLYGDPARGFAGGYRS